MATKPIKVSQLNSYIKRVIQLDPILGNVTVTGEISNLTFHRTGHVYFSLKDDTSRINCFLPSSGLKDVHFKMSEGMNVIINGYIGIYERGGSYSLNVRSIEPDGKGALAIAFEKLKNDLEEKGYFDEAHKKRIPSFPKKIAIATSDTGAAIEDILRVIKLKNSYVDIAICPCLVQGKDAAEDIKAAIEFINTNISDADVIILGRGGGSIEDLWAFNEEITAKAIYESEIPVISAVGHETDFTISDFVADLRAQTPTEAADIAVPDINEIKKYLAEKSNILNSGIDNFIEKESLALKVHSVENLSEYFLRNIENRLNYITLVYSECEFNISKYIQEKENIIEKNCEILETLNPSNLFERGFAGITDISGKLVNSVNDISENDNIKAVLKDGSMELKVLKVWRK